MLRSRSCACAVLLAGFLTSYALALPPDAPAGVADSNKQLLSVEFQDADVRSALMFLAQRGNINIVIDEEVRGRVTLRLEDVTWQQAVDAILRLKGLQMQTIGRVTTVKPLR